MIHLIPEKVKFKIYFDERWNSYFAHTCVYCKTYGEKFMFCKGVRRMAVQFFSLRFLKIQNNSQATFTRYTSELQIDCNSFIQYTITHRALGNKNHLHLFRAVLGHFISFKLLDLFKLMSSTYGHNVAVHFLFLPIHLCLSLLY